MDNNMISKGVTFLLTVIGLGIFYIVLMTKLEVMAQQTEASIHKMSADMAWENYLYQQTLRRVGQNQNQEEGFLPAHMELERNESFGN